MHEAGSSQLVSSYIVTPIYMIYMPCITRPFWKGSLPTPCENPWVFSNLPPTPLSFHASAVPWSDWWMVAAVMVL